jgi:hypothetical protein
MGFDKLKATTATGMLQVHKEQDTGDKPLYHSLPFVSYG